MSYPGIIPGSKVQAFNSTGKVGDVKLKMWTGIIVCDGKATVDISSAGFTQLLWVGATADGGNFAYTNMSENTTTSLSIGVKTSTATGLLVATGLLDGNCEVEIVVIGY